MAGGPRQPVRELVAMISLWLLRAHLPFKCILFRAVWNHISTIINCSFEEGYRLSRRLSDLLTNGCSSSLWAQIWLIKQLGMLMVGHWLSYNLFTLCQPWVTISTCLSAWPWVHASFSNRSASLCNTGIVLSNQGVCPPSHFLASPFGSQISRREYDYVTGYYCYYLKSDRILTCFFLLLKHSCVIIRWNWMHGEIHIRPGQTRQEQSQCVGGNCFSQYLLRLENTSELDVKWNAHFS